MKQIAVDLGGTRIKIGIIENGIVLSTLLLDSFSENGLIPRLPLIEEKIINMLKELKISIADVGGIGISIPGIVDTNSMKLKSINEKFDDAVGFDFVQWAKTTFNLPIFIENDARAALLGEWQYGAGKGCDNLVMITLGTGIGGAALVEGKLLRGKHFQAGCLAGHFTIDYKGPKCNCGNIGCGEQIASTHVLNQLVQSHPLFSTSRLAKSEMIDYRTVFGLASLGDKLAIEIVGQSLEAWSAVVISQIHAYDPETVIIGGGIMRSAPLILPTIIKNVNDRAWTPWGKVEIVEAMHPDFAALYGVEYLIKSSNKLYNDKFCK
jgi:glucokinase